MSKSKKLTPRRMGREWALQFLFQLDLRQTEFCEEDLGLFEDQLKQSPSQPKEREFNKGFDFAKELIDGVVENLQDIDSELVKYSSNWPIDRMAVVDRNLLRLGAYELLKTDLSAEIVINEALEISKAFSEKDSASFINAILDQINKNKA